MNSSAYPSDHIITLLRPLFTEKYREIHAFHLKGGGGAQVVKALSDLADTLLLKGFQSLNPKLAQEWGGTLIAIGGYGRQELSPGSDIDLMFLYPEGEEEETRTAASQLLCLLWDLGYKVGHSTRTIDQTISLARQDPLIATSLLESRFLHGDRTLFKTFHTAFYKKIIDEHIKEILSHLQEGRDAGRREFGATPYLLEPNVKQSPGGLRDIHSLKWVSCARYHTHHLPQIHQWGHLSNIEYVSLVQAQDFLWKIRNHLHFLAEKPADHLTIERQEEIAPFFQLKDRRGLMREYYLHTGRILEISKRFTREAFPVGRGQRWKRSWKTRQIAPGFQVFADELTLKSEKPFQFFDDDTNILRLFLLAKTHSVRIADSVLEVIYQVSLKKQEVPLTAAAFSLFKTLMTEPGGVAQTLRIMHRVHLLWRIIPEFSAVHCLVQESRSHTFTVDEHSFRAVEAAEQFLNEEGPLQELYVAIQRKDILHLAILLHDIGKGGIQDHSQVGGDIAERTAHRLGYNETEQEKLVFLVRKHLMLSEIALYRDFTNEPVLHQFVETVKTPELLRKLLILTCADIHATTPGAFTDWKRDLLLKLYKEASAVLTGKASDTENRKVAAITEKIFKTLRGKYPEAWLKEVLLTLLPRYYTITPFNKVLLDLDALSRLHTDPIQVEARFLENQGVTEYNLYTYDWITPGIFFNMVGVLTAQGLQILAAQVFTHPNGMVMDTFHVIDPDNQNEVPQNEVPDRLTVIKKDVERIFTGKGSVEQLLKKTRRFRPKKEPLVQLQKIRVEVDNSSSKTFTVIDVFATDKKGLLFTIAKVIFELGLSVHAARIATRLDQVVDVFYVLGPDQKKIVQPEAIDKIKTRLTQEIKAQFEK